MIDSTKMHLKPLDFKMAKQNLCICLGNCIQRLLFVLWTNPRLKEYLCPIKNNFSRFMINSHHATAVTFITIHHHPETIHTIHLISIFEESVMVSDYCMKTDISVPACIKKYLSHLIQSLIVDEFSSINYVAHVHDCSNISFH